MNAIDHHSKILNGDAQRSLKTYLLENGENRMNPELVFALVVGFVFLVVMCFVTMYMIKEQVEAHNSLPTLEEAQQEIETKYPEHVGCFILTKQVTDILYGSWGHAMFFYGNFLVCKELGISIQVRLGEKIG